MAHCHCSEFLGRESEEVDKLLLVDTNKGLIRAIGESIQTLLTIKDLLRSYDPNTKRLQTDIMNWILFFQAFIAETLDPFAGDNLDFLKQLQALPPSSYRKMLKLLQAS